jgi:transposase
VARRHHLSAETFLELLGGLEGESQIAVEATYGWEWLAELLEDSGYEIHLGHPLRTRAIAAARVKADAVDAKTLAHLLRVLHGASTSKRYHGRPGHGSYA